jgi:hypothetical protein
MRKEELLKGPLADQREAIQQAKRRADAANALQPDREYVDGEHWVFKLPRGKAPGRRPRDE